VKIVPSPSEDSQTYAIIGAPLEVHRCLGPGFLEIVYQEALSIEFVHRQIPHVREADLRVIYKEQILAATCRVDFLCYEQVLVELKAVKLLTNVEEAQVLNYVRASGQRTALLFNFGGPSLSWRRYVGLGFTTEFPNPCKSV
jgi:GxxExxY protein